MERFGQILRMDERRTVRQVLLNWVKPESILRDLVDADLNTVIGLAKGRIEWKMNMPSNAASTICGINPEVQKFVLQAHYMLAINIF